MKRKALVPIISLTLLILITVFASIIFTYSFSKYIEVKQREEYEKEKIATELSLIDFEIMDIGNKSLRFLNSGGITIVVNRERPIDIFCYSDNKLYVSQEYSNQTVINPNNSIIIDTTFYLSDCDFICVSYLEKTKCATNLNKIVIP